MQLYTFRQTWVLPLLVQSFPVLKRMQSVALPKAVSSSLCVLQDGGDVQVEQSTRLSMQLGMTAQQESLGSPP